MTPEQLAARIVRPLVFEPRADGFWTAGDELGTHYTITEYLGMANSLKLKGRGGFFYKTSYHPTLAAAQAAPEADYRAGILAALDLTPAVMLVEAVEPFAAKAKTIPSSYRTAFVMADDLDRADTALATPPQTGDKT